LVVLSDKSGKLFFLPLLRAYPKSIVTYYSFYNWQHAHPETTLDIIGLL